MFKRLVLIIGVLLISLQSQSQCALDNYVPISGGDVTPPAIGTSTVTGPTAGDYIGVNVIAGNVYTFSTCNGNTYDTQLTLYDNGSVFIDYNDDACGLQSTITWTATYSGVVYLQINQFNCVTNTTSTQIEITSAPPVQSGNGCNTDITICTPGVAGPFGFSTPGDPVSTCLDFFGPDYAYVVLYITQSGPLDLLVDGDATSGFMDVSVFTIPPGEDPCTAIQDPSNELGCSYAQGSDGCNQIGDYFPCTSGLDYTGSPAIDPGPNVNAGDVLFIVVENWSGTSTQFTLELGPPPSAQTGPPDPTINTVSLCDTDGATQLTAVNMGGTWSGTGVTSSGMFDPSVGPGVYAINYDIGNAPCSSSSTANITVTSCGACDITSGTVAMTSCYENGGFLEYDVAGSVSFVDAPTTGNLVLQDCYGATQNIASAPFTSPVSFTETNMPQVGGTCDFVAYFDAEPSCSITIPHNPPPPITGFNVSCTIGGGALDGNISFDDTYTSGTLVISVDDGTTVVQDVITLPTTSPQNWSVTGLDPAANPYTIDYYFSDFPSCGSQMAMNCGCAADAGTTTASISPSLGQNNFVLCDGDQLDITSDGNYTFPDDVGAIGGYAYQPELVYLVYSCPPTAGMWVGDDPCFVTLITSPVDLTDIDDAASWFNALGGSATFTDQTLYYTPITLYHYDPGVAAIVNSNCWDIGTVTSVTYLNPIVEVVTPDCQDSSITVNLTGGYPELFGGNYTASNLSPANASFVNTTAAHGGDIVINGLLNGQYWSFDVTDANGCPITISGGPFVGLPDANAGNDDSSCTLNYTLAATPSYGTGTWTGPVGISFGSANSATSSVTASTAGTYTLTWTEDNGGGCTDFDNVDITFSNPSYTVTIVDATCSSSNGEIILSATGGVTPYSYSIDNGSTTQTSGTFTGLYANSYPILIEDNTGCTITGTENVNNAGAPTIDNIAFNDPSCNSACDGDITLTVSGGTGPYQYSINGGALQATNSFTGLCDGAYNLLVEDFNGCQVTDNQILTEPSSISVTVNITDPLCFGDGGSIDIFASGGTVTSTYNYTINNGTSTSNTTGAFTSLSGGNYLISVTDNNTCLYTTSASITEPTAVGSVVNSTSNASCAGTCDGSADVSGTGGTVSAGYQYVWSDFSSQNTSIATGLCGGTPAIVYTVTITDDNGCETTRQVQIAEPSSLSITSSLIQSACNQSNGTACVTVTGGAGGYSYDWGTGGVTQCITGIPAGGYPVTVSDANFCTTTTNVVITDLGAPTINTTTTDVACFGGTEGASGVTVNGGTGPFSYEWTNSSGGVVSTISTAVNLSGGNYFIDVTDDVTGCVVSSSVSISEPTELQYSSSSTNITCFQGNDGEIGVSVIGGSGPYTYVWNTVPLQSSSTAINLTAGTYNVDIEDQNSCGTTLFFTLTEPTAITATEVVQDVSCYGGFDGSIVVSASGGTGGFTYSWNNNPYTSSTVINLGAGSQPYTVEDNSGCTFTASPSINQPSELVTMVINHDDVTCYNGTDGYIITNTFGGTSPYSYEWSFGLGTTQDLTGLSANTYCYTVTDGNGCEATACETINQPLQLVASLISVSDVQCYGDYNGYAAAQATGGTSPYFYQWNLGGNFSNQFEATNLGPTTNATVTVTDNVGCKTTTTTIITEPSQISLTGQIINSHCGQSDGSIFSHPNGGVLPYSYNWAPISNTTENLTGIPANAYATTITDANGCEAVQVFNVNDITGPTITALPTTQPTCNGYSNGIINTLVNGGTLPYQSFCWYDSNLDLLTCGAISLPLVPAGTYTEIVIDSAGCVASKTIILNQPTPVVAGITAQTNVSCFGGNDGQATVSYGGGTGDQSDFTYVWTPTGQTVNPGVGFSAGPIQVEVQDANGCSATVITTITQPEPLTIATTVTDVTCFGLSNGIIQASVSGGANGFYVYDWSCSSSSSSTIYNQPANICDLTITDQNGCTVSTSETINQPDLLTGSINFTDAYCTQSNGTATLYNVTGGTAPYSSPWTATSSNSFESTGLSYGTYTAQLTDANGCEFSSNVVISDQPGPQIQDIVYTIPTCFGDCDGTGFVEVTGGTSPLTYIWSDPGSQGTQTALNLCAGNYSVTVMDANNCIHVDYETLYEPSELMVAASPPTVSVCDGQCASIMAIPSGGSPPYNITWTDPSLTWFGPHQICLDASTTNTYSYVVEDSHGCQATNQSVVSVGPALVVTTPGPVETCLGNPVAICADGFGGSAISNYEWTWTNNGSTCTGTVTCCQTVNPTDTTVYLITLGDGGCSTPASGMLTVIVNPVPSPSFGVLENEGCPPFTAYFNGSASLDNCTIDWDFNGDGIIDTTDQDVDVGEFSYPVYTYQNSGLYTVEITATSEHNCSNSYAIQEYIDIYPSPIASFTTDPEGTTIINPVVNVDASNSIGVDSLYIWNFNDELNPVNGYGVENSHLYLDTGKYEIALDVVNTLGCHDYDTVLFIVDPDFAIYAPNAFTPDDDGTNDGFRLKGVGIDENNFELRIYDRWGEQIFMTTDFKEEWDGTIKGTDKIAPNDVYIWKAFVTPYEWTEAKELIGHVTLVK